MLPLALNRWISFSSSSTLQKVVTYPSNNGNSKFEKSENGGKDPDVDDGDDGEDEAPHDGGRKGQDGGKEAVEPELGVAEQDEG